ncbi:MAG: hypothetical protein ACRCTZ_09870 [Sarcina sp.]
MRYRVVQGVKKCIYKNKKGYLLLELTVGFAIVSIMLICVWSSFSTAMNLNTKALEKEESFKILEALKKEFCRNISFDGIKNLAGEKNLSAKQYQIRSLINIDFIEEKLGELEEVYVDFSDINDESINIQIYKDEYRVEVDKLKCVGIK